MLELLITTITLFIGLTILFAIPVIVHYLRFIMNLAQFTLNLVLLLKFFYKKHSLWNEPDFQPIHQLPFSPLSNILYKESNNSIFSNDSSSSSENIIDNFYFTKCEKIYSINPSKDFSKKCFENFYVNDLAECPISDIIVKDNQTDSLKDYKEVKIKNKYLYFTKKSESVKLYTVKVPDKISINNIISIFNAELNYEDIETIAKKENNKISNPIKPLKFYSKYFDYICLSLLIFSLFFFWGETHSEKKFNQFRIINLGIEIIIFLLFFIRYILFLKVKQFLQENDDIYNIKEPKIPELSEDYFPFSFYNIDSFPIAISINICLYYLFHCLFEEKGYLKYGGFYEESRGATNDKICLNKTLSFIPLFIVYIMIFFFDIKFNYNLIRTELDDILFNWETSPIKSIKLTDKKDCNYIFGKYKNNVASDWKGNYFDIGKMDSLNYKILYKNKEGKKCGKDSFGNDLFFPENSECPINDIFIINGNNDIDGYEKIPLNNSKSSLYYTNNNIEGEIIIDIKISNIFGPKLNLDKINISEKYINQSYSYGKYNANPFFSQIDKYDKNEFLYLYSIKYLGLNSSNIQSRDSFEKYIRYIESLDKFYLAKLIICIIYIIFIFIVYIILVTKKELEVYPIIIIINAVITLFHLLSLIIHIILIELFLNKINIYFEENKNSFIFGLFLAIINIIISVNYCCCSKSSDSTNNRDNEIKTEAERYNVNYQENIGSDHRRIKFNNYNN